MSSRYEVVEKLYESKNSLIWRGHRKTDGLAVILKHLNQDYPTPERIIRFRQEFEILHHLHRSSPELDSDGIIAVLDWERHQHSFYIVLEDFGGISLDNWVGCHPERRSGLEIAEFLPVAIAITLALGQVHQRQIIHKDINPANIVFNPKSGTLKLIDFGIATALPREAPPFHSPQALEGTLAYMSPEQTGRMNRAIDDRTDFYALGVTFYELLSGQLPFPATDILELLHSHLARRPLPLDQLRPIPAAIAAIVMKLLEKDPDHRYQSTAGLLADLRQCQEWLRQGEFGVLQPGQQDRSDRFHLPQRLYGRDQEIASLLAVFQQVSQPPASEPATSQLILIGGLSGIGKTALVQELYQPITSQRGYFISGKFDQFQRNLPYNAWIQALRSLVRQLLTESETVVQSWRERLLAAVGSSGQVIIDVIPEVALILGAQPAVPPLPPIEAQNRFRLAFQNFVRGFAQPAHPLVIFLDDLQWADAASLQLLESLMLSPEIRSLLVVGAYRPNEVGQTHLLQSTLTSLEVAGRKISTLHLTSLSLTDITHLIADTLHCPLAQAQPLADLIRTKTDGCPFFVRQLLQSLYLNHLIQFDYQQTLWQWDLKQIREWQISENVVGLMMAQIQQLAPSTQRVLQVAACLGNNFDLKTLALVQETSRQQILQALAPAISRGIVQPLGAAHPWMDLELEEMTESLTTDYRFVHDRVQQAAHNLQEKDQRGLHYRIGRLLLQHVAAAEQEERIFEIVNHLNQGSDLIQQESERQELARLNLLAAQKARDSTAYGAALEYCTRGLHLLGARGWQEQYDLTLTLGSAAAEAAYMSHSFETMDELVQLVQNHTHQPLEQVRVYQVKIQALICQDRLPEAIQTGREILKLLGVTLPDRPGEEEASAALSNLQWQLQNLEIASLLDRPAMTDPEAEAIMQILASLIPPTYNLMTHLFVLLVVHQVQLSVTRGNTALSCLAYALYGIVLCGRGEIERGYQFGQLALTLLERLDARPLQAGVTHLLILFVKHWKEPVQTHLPQSLAMYRLGLETGDFLYAAYSAHVYCAYALCSGQELTRLAPELDHYNGAIRELQQESALCLNQIVQQACLNLLGQADNPTILSGTAFDEQTTLETLKQVNNSTAVFLVLIYRLMLAYLFRDYPRALTTIAEADLHLQGVVGMFYVPIFHFYDSLTRLALIAPFLDGEKNSLGLTARSQHLERVLVNQEKLKQWADHAPANYLHKYHLVAAELARVEGKDGEAREHYDRAIDLAFQADYLNEGALANELAARFYLSRQRARIAQVYFQEAHYAYGRWGAVAKVQHLETHYPDFLTRPSETISSPIVSTHPETSASQVHAALDLTSVVRASQAISEEIILPNLLKKLLRIALENAGAQRGFLILGQQTSLTVEMGCQIKGETQQDEEVLLQQPIPLEQASPYLATAIVHYVARTQEDLVLAAATEAIGFSQDDYVQKHSPKSVLCMPILRGGQLFGLLYLENPLVTNSFTPDRVKTLHLLSTQAAISLENARLYANLETIVADRTAQLQAALAELETLAITDKLTGVYNRRKFEDIIDQEINRALRFQHSLSLVVLDIDWFKSINDTYGHLAGDRVLATLARLIQENIRNIDTLIRWGGEEFLILASETPLEQAMVLAEKLRQMIDQYSFPEVTHVTISLGVAEFHSGDTPLSLTERADHALYQAKRNGRNRVEVALQSEA